MRNFYEDFDKDISNLSFCYPEPESRELSVADFLSAKWETPTFKVVYIDAGNGANLVDEETGNLVLDSKKGVAEQRSEPARRSSLEEEMSFASVFNSNQVVGLYNFGESCDLYSVNLDEFLAWSVEQELRDL